MRPMRPHWRQPQLTTRAAVLILAVWCLLVPWGILAFLYAVLP